MESSVKASSEPIKLCAAPWSFHHKSLFIHMHWCMLVEAWPDLFVFIQAQ